MRVNPVLGSEALDGPDDQCVERLPVDRPQVAASVSYLDGVIDEQPTFDQSVRCLCGP